MTRKAVLCGINQYKTQTALRGCLNDLKNMHQILTEAFEFEPNQIHQVKDEQVTKDVILQEWQWLIQEALPGDQLFFHLSGHGSYVIDDQVDEEDGYDEITCLYDMDFDNPESFIRDDEWNDLIQAVPSNVDLTFVMDSCHSGTGTRNLPVKLNGVDRSIAIDGNSSTRSLREIAQFSNDYPTLITDESIVLPRFLVPPMRIQEQRRAIAHRSSSLSVPQSENVLVVTACRADQTAADAYLEQDFYGAFTYYLCQQIRQSPRQSSQSLINTVKQSLLANQFLQEPQHEGANRITGFLRTTKPPVFSNCSGSNQDLFHLPAITYSMELSMQPNQLLTSDNQRLLIEAYTKLLDTVSNSTCIDDDSGISVAVDRQTQNHYLVYVHGISRHSTGYSNSWWNALRPHVRGIFGSGILNSSRKEVLWSDLVNARSLDNNDVDPIEKEKLRLQIEAVLDERQRQITLDAIQEQGSDPSEIRSLPMSRSRELITDDFLIYMINAVKRQEIIDRFTKVIWPLLQTNSRVDIISHSWGSVVAYEGLRELESNQNLQGRVSNFFTVGSALSILPVWFSLRPENRNGRRPSMVDHWFNLDAEGDLVGGTLRDKFEVTQEFLNLKPVSCEKRWFIYDNACAHSSYFSANNVAVNRDIFARYILS